MKIAAVVVIYNPKINKVILNIKSFTDRISNYIIVDNSESEQDFSAILNQNFGNLTYIKLGTNRGIATALNIGCSKAIEFNCTHTLTMDQDSFFDEGHFDKLIRTKILLEEDCAILTPFHSTRDDYPKDNHVSRIDSCMTSGNILNLNAFLKVGGFLDKLFIDYVDHEFCFRLNLKGYKIYENRGVILKHELGDISKVNILGKSIYLTNHSPIRRYYRTRNFLYFFKLYILKRTYKTLISLKFEFLASIGFVFFEKDKKEKMKYVFLGINDFIKGKYGKI